MGTAHGMNEYNVELPGAERRYFVFSPRGRKTRARGGRVVCAIKMMRGVVAQSAALSSSRCCHTYSVLISCLVCVFVQLFPNRWRGSLAELMAKADQTGHLRDVLDLHESSAISESAPSEGNWGQDYNTSAVSFIILSWIQVGMYLRSILVR